MLARVLEFPAGQDPPPLLALSIRLPEGSFRESVSPLFLKLPV
jgi:hypothetical protein